MFASTAIRDKYFQGQGQDIGMTKEAIDLWDKATINIPSEEVRKFFRGWDFSNFNFWKIISATAPKAGLSELQGLDIDMHYLVQEQEVDNKKLEKQFAKKLKELSTDNSQFFLLYSDRGVRKGAYAIMELHKSGESCKDALLASNLKLDKELFSTCRIW